MVEKSAKKKKGTHAYLILLAILFFMISAVGGAVWYAKHQSALTAAKGEVKEELKGEGENEGEAGGGASDRRFRAKAGTTRENALALTTRKREHQEGAAKNPEGAPASEKAKDLRIRARSLSRPEEEEKLSDLEKQVRSALNNITPGKGVEKLKASLDSAVTPEEKVRVHTAMAQLYMECDPPDTQNAEKALEEAISEAPTLVDRAKLIQSQAELYVQRGAIDAARDRVSSALSNPATPGPVKMALQTTLGFIEENAGAPEKAEEAYKAVIDHARHMGAITNPEILDTIRNAGMRLSRIYRNKHQDKEADTLVEEVHRLLAPAAPSEEGEGEEEGEVEGEGAI